MDLAQIVFLLFQFKNGHSEGAIRNRAKNAYFSLYFKIFHVKSVNRRNRKFGM